MNKLSPDLKRGKYEATINDKNVAVYTYFLSERQGNAEVIEHDSVMRLGRELGVTFNMEHSGVEAYVVGNTLSVISRAQARGLDTTTNKEIEVVEYHEAHSDNLGGKRPQDRFPVRMAWKRAQDKAILEIARPMLQGAGLPEHLYSDLEFDYDEGNSQQQVDTSWLQGGAQQFPNIQMPTVQPQMPTVQPIVNPFPQPQTLVPQPIAPGTIVTDTNTFPMQTSANDYQAPPGQYVIPPEVANNFPFTPNEAISQAFNPFQNEPVVPTPNIPVESISQAIPDPELTATIQAVIDKPVFSQEEIEGSIVQPTPVVSTDQLICVECEKQIVSEGEAKFSNDLLKGFVEEGKIQRANRCYDCGVNKYSELNKGAFEPSE